MSVFKQYQYNKITDCKNCSYYQNDICTSPLPGINTCKFIINKKWNNTYFFKTSIYGKQYIRRGYSSENEAYKAEKEFREEMLVGRTYRSNLKDLPSFKALLIKYGKYVKKNVKASYGITIEKKIKNYYIHLLPDIPVNKLLKCHAEKLRKTIDKENITCASKNNKLNFMKRFFIWIDDNYNFKYNAILVLHKFKDYNIKRTPLRKKIVEFDEFIEIYKNCDSSYYKLALLIMFLYGLRLGEQLALQVNSFDFESKTFETYQTTNFKTGNGSFILEAPKTRASERHHLMSDELICLIKSHIKNNNLKENDFIFFRYTTTKSIENHKIPVHENTFRRECERYCKKYNKDFHPHMLRTSAVTYLREKGVPLEDISSLVGHKETSVTDIYYSKTSLNKEKLINVVIKEKLKKVI